MSRREASGFISIVLSAIVGLGGAAAQEPKNVKVDWSLNVTVIEACSCPVFCQCYFGGKPAAPASAHDKHDPAGKHFQGTNGLVTTVEITSKDVQKK